MFPVHAYFVTLRSVEVRDYATTWIINGLSQELHNNTNHDGVGAGNGMACGYHAYMSHTKTAYYAHNELANPDYASIMMFMPQIEILAHHLPKHQY